VGFSSGFNKYEAALRNRSKDYPDIVLDIRHVAFNLPKTTTSYDLDDILDLNDLVSDVKN